MIAILAAASLGLAPGTASPFSQGHQQGRPLTLREAVLLARDHSFEVRANRKDIAASEAASRQARDGLMPTLEVQVSGNYSQLPDEPALASMSPIGQLVVGFPTDGSYADTTLQASVPIFDGFATRHALAVANDQVKIDRLGLTLAEQAAETDAAIAYLQLLRARHLADVASDAVVQSQEHLRLGKERLATGFGTRAELLQLEADLAHRELALIQANNQVDAARLTLETDIDARLGDRPLDDQPIVPPIGPTASDPLAATLERREDIRQQVLKEDASQERAGLDAAGYWPHVQAFGQYTERGTHLPLFAGGLTIDWQAFDGFRGRDRIAQAHAEASADAARLEEMKRAAALQVQLLEQRIDECQERIPASRSALSSAMEAYRIATDRYRLGFAVLADLLDARTTLLDARTGYINAIYDLREAQIQLARAQGLDLAAYLAPGAERKGAGHGAP